MAYKRPFRDAHSAVVKDMINPQGGQSVRASEGEKNRELRYKMHRERIEEGRQSGAKSAFREDPAVLKRQQFEAQQAEKERKDSDTRMQAEILQRLSGAAPQEQVLNELRNPPIQQTRVPLKPEESVDPITKRPFGFSMKNKPGSFVPQETKIVESPAPESEAVKKAKADMTSHPAAPAAKGSGVAELREKRLRLQAEVNAYGQDIKQLTDQSLITQDPDQKAELLARAEFFKLERERAINGIRSLGGSNAAAPPDKDEAIEFIKDPVTGKYSRKR